MQTELRNRESSIQDSRYKFRFLCILAKKVKDSLPRVKASLPRVKASLSGVKDSLPRVKDSLSPGLRTASPGSRPASPGSRTSSPGSRTSSPGSRPPCSGSTPPRSDPGAGRVWIHCACLSPTLEDPSLGPIESRDHLQDHLTTQYHVTWGGGGTDVLEEGRFR